MLEVASSDEYLVLLSTVVGIRSGQTDEHKAPQLLLLQTKLVRKAVTQQERVLPVTLQHVQQKHQVQGISTICKPCPRAGDS